MFFFNPKQFPFPQLRQFQIRETTGKQFYAGFQWNIIPIKINFAVRGVITLSRRSFIIHRCHR